MMNGALTLYLLDSQTVNQIDKAAKALGGTVMLNPSLGEKKPRCHAAEPTAEPSMLQILDQQ